MALTEKAVDRLGASIGDTVRLGDESRHWSVVGVVEFPARLGQTVLFHPTGFPLPEPAGDGYPTDGWLADTPADVTWPDVKRLNQHGLLVVSRAVVLDPPPASESPFGVSDEGVRALAGGALIAGLGVLEVVLLAGLGVLEVVLLAGPAFAVGRPPPPARPRARRRERRHTGPPAPHAGRRRRARRGRRGHRPRARHRVRIRRPSAGRVTPHPLPRRRLPGLPARPGRHRRRGTADRAADRAAGRAGARVTAARQDVVAALSGRRPPMRSKKRWLVVGLAMTGLGTVVAGYGAWQVSTEVILAGLILGELGLVLCTPSLVGLIARVGRVLPLAPRIALRDLARNRAAAAPAISAVMAAVAGSVAIGAYLSSSRAQHEAGYLPSLPPGYAMVVNGPGPDAPPITAPERLTQAMRASLPVADIVRLEEPACPADAPQGTYCGLGLRMPEERRCPLWALPSEPTAAQKKAAARDDRCRDGGGYGWLSGPSLFAAVDDGSTVATLTGAAADDAAAAAATLRAGGVVVADERFVVDGRATLTIARPGQQTEQPVEEKDLPSVTAPAYVLRTGVLADGAVIYSPQVVAAAGLRTTLAGLLAATTRMPTQAEVDRLNAKLHDLDEGVYVSVERGPQTQEPPELVVLAIAAGLITLGAAGIATGLAAADEWADLSTLAAVGASPRVRRLLSLSQSGVIAGLGPLLGVTAGLGASFAALYALNQGYTDSWPVRLPYPVVVPWKSLAIVLVVPLVAMLGTGLLTRSRLPIERRTG